MRRPSDHRAHPSGRSVAAALVAVLLLGLAGCGGQDAPASPKTDADPGTSSTALPSPSASASSSLKIEQPEVPPLIGELRTAVQAYSDAYLTGDVVASRALLSERCKLRIGPGEWAATVKAAGQQYGEKLPITSYDAQVSGDLARVTYGFARTELDQDREPWVREDGDWHEDDC